MHSYPAAILLGVTAILAIWCVGGRREWALQLITQCLLWSGIILHFHFLFRLYREKRRPPQDALPVSWKEPLCAWALLLPWVILFVLGWRGTYNPAFVPLDNTLLAEIMALPHAENRPTTINPLRSRMYLAFYGALTLFLAGAWLTLRSRRAIRLLLGLLLANGALLTLLGIAVNASGSDKILWFIESHSPSFFATIYYKNHWGALVVLWTGIAVGLALDAWERARDRLGFPDLAVACVLLLPPLLLSLIMAQARASILAATGVFSVAASGLFRLVPEGPNRRLQVSLFALAFVVSVGSILWVARPQAERIYHRSERQITLLMESESVNPDARMASYRSALSVIADRPVWGWGAGSYPYIYPLHADERLIRPDGKPLFFEFVHNDYLQLLAEHGIAGAFLVILTPLLVLIVTWKQPSTCLCFWAGCGLAGVLLLAVVDFPFGNPSVTLNFALLAVAALAYRRLSAKKAK